MSIIQKIGIGFILVGGGLLIALLFISRYEISEETLKQAINNQGEQAEVKAALNEIINKTYGSSFAINSAIESNLKNANDEIKTKYSITESDLEKVLAQFSESNITYDNKIIDQMFDDSAIGQFKREQLTSYTSWMNDREYDREALRDQLENTRNNINRSIIGSKGYNEYKIKSLQLAITRHATLGPAKSNTLLMLFLTIGLGIIGGLLYILPKVKLLPGIKNNHIFHSKNTNRGWIGYTIGFLFIAFYIILYWYPEYMTSWMLLVDPVSVALSGNLASQWFFYGFLYTIAIVVMGIRMIIKYRHSKYHIIRTGSVMFFQTAFAFLIPEILVRLNQPSMDLKNIWPLNYTFFYDYNLETLTTSGSVGLSMLVWGTGLALIGVPVITYFYGKRWYCSWVCGCGGLAETLGDPYRQLSDKSLKAWQVERWMVHGVLVFSVVMTFAVLYTYFTGNSTLAGINSYDLRSVYGFAIGAAFAGVVGVGFYPLMGNRVWCRFGCPLAAYLGIIQRFKSRFRITTNGGQCISCGNCSTYCEMGIDVRAYAQKGQNIIRASCVGCGVCSSVCPRGVLKLENKDPKGRFNEPILIGNDGVKVQG
ncbi:MAG: 4Fe-4S binding protein [Fulvivirga sp.]